MHVLVIDDDVRLVDLLMAYLRQRGLQATAMPDGEAALQALETTAFDVILLDVMMPRSDGYEVLRKIRRRSYAPVIMLTARTDESDRVRGLEEGADDYVTKPFSTPELVARIQALARRSHINRSVSEIGDLRLDLERGTVWVDQRVIELTGTELRALETLCSHPGKPVARDALYRIVLKRSGDPTDRSLDTHISNLRRKLGERADGGQRIRAVRGVGYQYCP